ncbi:MAG: hypothetical protein AUG74_07700 [Bacteroidetes bacterium 13_1_20CM_4_60_6]|jgi:hypothetical protein|nr:hypothetical protein [Delftia sp.]KEH11082.1 hypothetical protein GY15_29845 [Delftia sp. 670]OLE70244.1 MAG: hypothetical protein AUG74_07700 [Bacteroidetes bacterium 13_1_20CM_4_60_6]OLE94770.1 MAG: hypothetical protein AUI84_07625 [Delftia sp. 13_1_40CM_3_66_6]PQA79683.1 hypothetical protein C5F52_28945 [Limnohabitans sp. TS-CS-82]BDE74795.1 hypothetical protein HQS1_59190 [Delftia lacustris]HBY36386.1 hypothetical protein [Delftia acidovorans]
MAGRGEHAHMPDPHTPPSTTPAQPLTMHSARITAAMRYRGDDGRHRTIPKGPCLIEKMEGPVVEVIWGAKGQNCTMLPLNDVEGAAARGDLVLLD